MTLPNRNSQKAAKTASFVRSLRHALPVLLIIALGAGLVTFGLFSTLKSKSAAEVQLQLSTAGTTTGDTTRREANGVSLAEHAAALGSRPMLLAVAAKLELTKRPEFSGAGNDGIAGSLLALIGLGGGGQGDRERAVLSAIREGLSIIAQNDRAIITLRYEGYDAALAARLVRELGDTYLRHLADAPIEESKRQIGELTSKLATARMELVRGEGELEKLRAEARDAQAEDPRLSALKQRLAKAEDERQSAEADWQAALRSQNSADAGAVGTSNASDALRTVVRRRNSVKQQLAQAKKRLLPAHPRLQRLRNEIARLDRIVKRELARETKVLEHAFRTAVLRLQDLRGEFADLSAKTVKPNVDVGRLAALEADVDTRRSQVQELETRIAASQARAASLEPIARAEIAVPARVISRQAASSKVCYTLSAMLLAFVLGCIFVLVRDVLARQGRQAEPVTTPAVLSDAEGPAIEATPMLPLPHEGDQDGPADEEPVAPLHSAVEAAQAAVHEFRAIEGIAEHLLERGQDVNGLRSMLVGEHPGIDPSEEAMELVHRLSQDGAQVIVVDWSPDRDGLTHVIGLAHRPGISELMRGTATFEDAITNIPDSRVHHMSAGLAMDFDFAERDGELNPDSECLNMILDALDDVYDHIVVVGRSSAATVLFEAIEGRFDAGIIVQEGDCERAPLPDDDNTFLGFEVADIDIVRIRRTLPVAVSGLRRLQALEKPTVYA